MNERIAKLIHHPALPSVGIGVAGLGVGLAIGYILGKRNQNVTDPYIYNLPSPMEHDSKEMEKAIANLEKKHEIEEETVTAYVGGEDVVIPEFRDGKLINGKDFVASKIREALEQDAADEDLPDLAYDDEEWDWEEENEHRSKANPDNPYILHRDEFYAGEMGYTQYSLTYFVGDDMMVDEEDKPVPNYQRITGPLFWGHGSGDENIVLIRNKKLRAEYEITKNDDSYAFYVLAQEPDDVTSEGLRHSELRRFKMD